MDRWKAGSAHESRRLAERAAELLRSMPEADEALALGLCGSVARGNAGPHSDIDVFVIIPLERWSDDAERRWWEIVRRALAPLEREVSVMLYTPLGIRKVGNWYVLRLVSDAVFVRDTDGQIEALFRRVKEKALASGFVDRDGDGNPYWEYTGDASKGWKLELEEE